MGAIAFVAQKDLRRHMPRILVLVLVIGVAGGCVMTAIAGARRTSSSLERFRSAGRSADIQLAAQPTAKQIDQLAHAPGVRALATLTAFALLPTRAPDFDTGGVPDDETFGSIIDRDRIVAGRSFDANAPDEIMIGEGLAQRLGLGIGDTVDFDSQTPDQIDRFVQGEADVGPPAGPHLRMRIVGIVRRPLDLGEENAVGGLIVISPAFAHVYAERIGVFGKYVRIRADDPSAVPDVLAAARRILGPSQVATQSLALESQGANIAIDVLSLALWIAAGVALVAGSLAVAIVLSREVFLVVVDHRRLRDLGCTRRQRLGVVVPSTALIAALGSLLACALTVLSSPLLPVGVARRADPDVGFHADWKVLALSSIVIVAFVAAVSAITAARATRPVHDEQSRRLRRRATFATSAAAAMGVGPTVSNGVRMAVDPGDDTNAVPVRAAFVGTVVGIAGVTATLVLATSLGHLAATPDHYGVEWDFNVLDTSLTGACGGEDHGVTKTPGVSSMSEVCIQNLEISGRPTPGLAFTSLRGDPIEPKVTSGRAPRRANEVALGAKTLSELDKSIGDTVRVRTSKAERVYVIVGRAVLPTFDRAVPLADGAIFTGAGYTPLFDRDSIYHRQFVGVFAPGAAPAEVLRQIDALDELGTPATPAQPVEIARMEELRGLANVMIVILCALATIAIAHALVTTVRRRRRELAVLKTLGFVRGQVRGTVACQAGTLTLVGLVVGVPAGILVGRFAWRLVTDALGVASPAQLGLVAILFLVPLTVVAIQLMAYLPARVAGRTRIAAALRSE